METPEKTPRMAAVWFAAARNPRRLASSRGSIAAARAAGSRKAALQRPTSFTAPSVARQSSKKSAPPAAGEPCAPRNADARRRVITEKSRSRVCGAALRFLQVNARSFAVTTAETQAKRPFLSASGAGVSLTGLPQVLVVTQKTARQSVQRTQCGRLVAKEQGHASACAA